MTDQNHAISNARAWAASILSAMEALAELERDSDQPVQFDGEEFDSADSLRERIEEMPLSVQVRDGWRSPGAEKADAEEFEILLSTGGPALRIFGKIGGEHELQWQDWGTPWTDHRDLSDDERDAIESFVGLFYFED